MLLMLGAATEVEPGAVRKRFDGPNCWLPLKMPAVVSSLPPQLLARFSKQSIGNHLGVDPESAFLKLGSNGFDLDHVHHGR